MAGLNDEMATRIMGEIDTVTKRIDAQIELLDLMKDNITVKLKYLVDHDHKLVQSNTDLQAGISTEINQLIEITLAKASAAAENRDLAVIEDIVVGVDKKLTDTLSGINESLSLHVSETVSMIQAESLKAIKHTNDVGRWKWLLLASIGVLCLMASVGYGAWVVAENHFDEQVRAMGFSSRAEAQAAIKFGQINNLPKMLACDGYTEHRQNGHLYCVPMDADRVVSGWRID